VLRNYPVIGHLRFLLDSFGRDAAVLHRRRTTRRRRSRASNALLVYQRAKGAPDKRPFGTQMDVGATGYEWINHRCADPARDARLSRDDRRRPRPTLHGSVFNIFGDELSVRSRPTPSCR